MSDELKRLAARFDPATEVKSRMQKGMKLDYIPIDVTIKRFNDVLGTEWSFETWKTKVTYSHDDPKQGRMYLALVSGCIRALNKSASGVGADIANDPDKAIKTALAEALKKAGHQFGVGLYLWDAGERAAIDTVRVASAQGDRLTVAKTKIQQIAMDAGIEPTAEAIAKYFNCSVMALQDVMVLEAILEAEAA